MSKSKGNGVDPVEMVEKYGADALRFALIVGNVPGADQALSEDKIRGYRNFANKVWNVARFIDVNLKLMLDNPDASSPQWEPLVAISGDDEAFKNFIAGT